MFGRSTTRHRRSTRDPFGSAPRVGLPRALLTYRYYALWREFLVGLGCEVVEPPWTNQRLLDDGVRVTVDDICIPVKVFAGHLLCLRECGVDAILVPWVYAVEDTPSRRPPGGKGWVGMNVYLGIDVGSVSTNVAVLDEDGEVVLTEYLRTRGDPRRAVAEGLLSTRERLDPVVAVRGVGTTGSARRFSGVLVGADVVKNEIIAHATAARHLYPDVSTVLEIGGQDSKIIILRDGIVVDFAMNTVCAAGSGSRLSAPSSRRVTWCTRRSSARPRKTSSPVCATRSCATT